MHKVLRGRSWNAKIAVSYDVDVAATPPTSTLTLHDALPEEDYGFPMPPASAPTTPSTEEAVRGDTQLAKVERGVSRVQRDLSSVKKSLDQAFDEAAALDEDNAEIDPYEILKIARDCSQPDIKKAYRTMALKLHPDRQVNKSEAESAAAERQMSRINLAHVILSDPYKRGRYDAGWHIADIVSINDGPNRVSQRARDEWAERQRATRRPSAEVTDMSRAADHASKHKPTDQRRGARRGMRLVAWLLLSVVGAFVLVAKPSVTLVTDPVDAAPSPLGDAAGGGASAPVASRPYRQPAGHQLVVPAHEQISKVVLDTTLSVVLPFVIMQPAAANGVRAGCDALGKALGPALAPATNAVRKSLAPLSKHAGVVAPGLVGAVQAAKAAKAAQAASVYAKALAVNLPALVITYQMRDGIQRVIKIRTTLSAPKLAPLLL